MSLHLKNYELGSLDMSGANSVYFKLSRPGVLSLNECFTNITTLTNSTANGVVKLYSTGNALLDASTQERPTSFSGTITVTDTTYTVTGSSTAFTTEYNIGDIIKTNGGNEREIVAIASDTSMTVGTAWSATESGVAHGLGARHIATLTVPTAQAVGSQIDFLAVEDSDDTFPQPKDNNPYFNHVKGDLITVTVTTALTTAGVGNITIALAQTDFPIA